ncbi:hypothetical protein BD410DRAFT_822090, partial [Rickenella mellea]
MTSPPSRTPITDLIRNLRTHDATIKLRQSEDLHDLKYLGIQPQSFLVAKLPVDIIIKYLLSSIRIVAVTLSLGLSSGKERRRDLKICYENSLNNRVLGKNFVICDVLADFRTVLVNKLLPQRDYSYLRNIHHRGHVHMSINRATPTIDISNGRDIVAITRSTPELIHILSKIGWEHRDLNPGNVYSRSGNPKIAEFEFSNKIAGGGETKPHDFCTGTRQFWSLEIEAGKLLHLPPTDSLEVALGWLESNGRRPFPLRRLPLHDLESLWWIFAWILLMRVPKNPSANWSEKRHRRVLDAIFPTVPGFTGRLEFLTGDPTLTLDVLKAIDEQLVPLLFNLLKFQLHLLSAFRRYEAALRGSTGDDLALVKAFSEHKPLPESPEKSGDAFV